MPPAFPLDFIAPLPPPRPADMVPPHATAPPATPPSPQPLATAPDPACARVLSSAKLIAVSVPPIIAQDGCGIAEPVTLSAVVLDDGTRIPFDPSATLRCALAEALGDWVRGDIAPLAQKAGGGLVKIIGSNGYECRSRNRVSGAKLSEHGKGNAYDMLGFALRDGRQLSIAKQTEAQDVMTQLKAASCARFMTVLGPGSDGFHQTHLHVDLEERRKDGRICHWQVN